MTITSQTFYDTTRNTDDDEHHATTATHSSSPSNIAENQNHIIKKKQNDSFFNDILTKSDTLLAQTQQKMERLSRLETVAKPLAPAIPTPAVPPQPKPKPMATILTNNTNNSISSTSINNSKSLIDLKQNNNSPTSQIISQNIEASSSSSNNNNSNNNNNTQVDLLFDLNDHSFTLNTEPIAQTNSYFDLIGLDSTNNNENNNNNNNNNNNENKIVSNVNILQSLFDSSDANAIASPFENEHASGVEDDGGIKINQSSEVLQQVCIFDEILLYNYLSFILFCRLRDLKRLVKAFKTNLRFFMKKSINSKKFFKFFYS